MRNGDKEAVIYKGKVCELGGGVIRQYLKHLREVHSPVLVGLSRPRYTMLQ